MRVVFGVTTVLGLVSLAACGGGGGGVSSGGGSATPTPVASATAPAATPAPKPSATSSPASTQATATGTVVDYAANTPLSGVQIAIAAYTPGAAPSPVATTAANGTFSFSASAGTYLLVIGSNNPNDTTTTLHTKITLAAGTNALTLPIPTSPANVTLTAAQISGNYRLTALAGDQLSCFIGANQGRTQDMLPLLIPDESLTEYAAALAQEESAQAIDTPSPLFSPGSPSLLVEVGDNAGNGGGQTTSVNFLTCASWTGPSYSYENGNPPFQFASVATNIWYGAQRSGNSTVYGAQLWTGDGR